MIQFWSLAQEDGFRCYPGSEHNELDCYYQAAKEYESDRGVRITADSPLIERSICDRMADIQFGLGMDNTQAGKMFRTFGS
jgi:spore coat polysaccharide biosynthesis protein SpsF (cytidylyltransferase family)